MDLGYLAVQAGYQMAAGVITSSSASINAGRLGVKNISNKELILGDALVFDKSSVDKYNY
jgi:rhamnose transport system substrate-binding protein/rhamnose transport system permease protein